MAAKPTSPVTTVALNEALLLGSLRQHELIEAADILTARLEAEITARRQTAGELAEKARLLDLTNDAIIIHGLDGRISYWNRGAEDLYGWPSEMALGKACHKLLKSVFPVPLKQIMAELHRNGHWTGEMVHTKQDGKRVTVLVRKVLDRDEEGNPASVLENNTDITERKQAEDALRESERRFRLALRNSPVSIAIQDRNLVYQWAYNQKSRRTDEIIGKTDADLFDPEDVAWIKEVKQRVLESGKDVHVQHWVTSNGQRMFLDLTYEPLQDQDGEVTSIGIAAVDLTQQKLVEEALKVSEERHRLLAETMLQGVVHQDASGTIIAMNPAAERILGKTREQFMGGNSVREEHQTIREDGSSFPGLEHPAMVALQTGQVVREVVMGVFNPQLGDYRWISIDAVPLIPSGENRPAEVYAVFEDITERKRAEEKISTLNRELENRVLERTNELQGTVTALESEIQERHRLERGILEISEREQCRLGQDMHDGLGQELSGIAMLGDALTKELRAQINPLTKDAGKLATYVRRALDSTRRLAKGLYPIELERNGLRLALKDLAEQTNRLTRIHCKVSHSGAEPKLDKSTEIHIYRIIQECIGNAVKHAMPKRIIIESHTDDGVHIFSVTDDGEGFNVSAGSSGMGLHLMHYRARLIHAELTIEQPETGGCRISCRLKEGDPKGGMP